MLTEAAALTLLCFAGTAGGFPLGGTVYPANNRASPGDPLTAYPREHFRDGHFHSTGTPSNITPYPQGKSTYSPSSARGNGIQDGAKRFRDSVNGATGEKIKVSAIFPTGPSIDSREGNFETYSPPSDTETDHARSTGRSSGREYVPSEYVPFTQSVTRTEVTTLSLGENNHIPVGTSKSGDLAKFSPRTTSDVIPSGEGISPSTPDTVSQTQVLSRSEIILNGNSEKGAPSSVPNTQDFLRKGGTVDFPRTMNSSPRKGNILKEKVVSNLENLMVSNATIAPHSTVGDKAESVQREYHGLGDSRVLRPCADHPSSPIFAADGNEEFRRSPRIDDSQGYKISGDVDRNAPGTNSKEISFLDIFRYIANSSSGVGGTPPSSTEGTDNNIMTLPRRPPTTLVPPTTNRRPKPGYTIVRYVFNGQVYATRLVPLRATTAGPRSPVTPVESASILIVQRGPPVCPPGQRFAGGRCRPQWR